MFLSAGCHWVTLQMTESLQLPPEWLIHKWLLSMVRVPFSSYKGHLVKVLLIVFVQDIGVFEKWSDLLMEAKCSRKATDCVKQLSLSPPKVVFLVSVQANANSPNSTQRLEESVWFCWVLKRD